jgi:hypothetical protein
MLEITPEMLDAIEAVKGKRNPALWDPRCEQYFRASQKKSPKKTAESADSSEPTTK